MQLGLRFQVYKGSSDSVPPVECLQRFGVKLDGELENKAAAALAFLPSSGQRAWLTGPSSPGRSLPETKP